MIYHNVDVFFVHIWKLFREDNHAEAGLPWLCRPSSKFGVYVVLNNLHVSSSYVQELIQSQQWALSRATNPQGQSHMANAAEI